MLDEGPGGYGPDLAPEMTSEIEGSDWRFEDSSSTGFRGSTEEIMLEMLAPEE